MEVEARYLVAEARAKLAALRVDEYRLGRDLFVMKVRAAHRALGYRHWTNFVRLELGVRPKKAAYLLLIAEHLSEADWARLGFERSRELARLRAAGPSLERVFGGVDGIASVSCRVTRARVSEALVDFVARSAASGKDNSRATAAAREARARRRATAFAGIRGEARRLSRLLLALADGVPPVEESHEVEEMLRELDQRLRLLYHRLAPAGAA